MPALGSDRATTIVGSRSASDALADTQGDEDPHWVWARTLLVLVYLVIYADMLIAFRTYRPHPAAVIGLVLVGGSPLLRSLEPNPLIGIRTPWTMRSERCWARTHRFAVLPTLFVGLALIGLDVTDANPGWPVIGGLMAAWTGGLTLYSYVQWRNDPVR